MTDKRKYYRIVFADEPEVSPCPDERWDMDEDDIARGLAYWEQRTGRKMEAVEEKP